MAAEEAMRKKADEEAAARKRAEEERERVRKGKEEAAKKVCTNICTMMVQTDIPSCTHECIHAPFHTK